jgi:hypothetical protein
MQNRECQQIYGACFDCAIGLSTGAVIDPLAGTIRSVQTNKASSFFDLRIATHGFVIINLGTPAAPMWFVAEMLADGLKVHPMSKYTKRSFGGGLLYIMKFPELHDNPDRVIAFKWQILRWWNDGKKYDYDGLLEKVIPSHKDKPQNFYCTEMIEAGAKFAGVSLVPQIIATNDEDDVTPYELQMSPKGFPMLRWDNGRYIIRETDKGVTCLSR